MVFSVWGRTIFCTVTNVGAEPVAFSFDGDAAKGDGCVPSFDSTTGASGTRWLIADIKVGEVITQSLTPADCCSWLPLLNCDNVSLSPAFISDRSS